MSVGVSDSDQDDSKVNVDGNPSIEDRRFFDVKNYEGSETGIGNKDEIISDVTDNVKRDSFKEADDLVTELDPFEIERKQREANEETTRSEDLKLFLQEMKQKFPQMDGYLNNNVSNKSPQSVQRMLSINSENTMNLSPYKDVTDPFQECDIQTMAAETASMGPPDGGWAWLVVLASFFCMIIIDGTCFNYGLVVPDMMGSFTEITIQHYMWPGSLLSGFYMSIGPIASVLSNQYDFRPVAIAGALISGVAIFASSFVNDLWAFVLCFGVFGGIGFGLIYLPAIAIVGHWFNEKRPIAVGVALCGSGCGTFLFGQLMPILIDIFTWKGIVILISAACVQALVLVSFFRPLELHLRLQQLSIIRTNLRKIQKAEQKLKRLEFKQKRDVEKNKRKTEKDLLRYENRMKNKKIVIYRGNIMQKIIEEKKRQRTVSMGSLDGMVITRDNELIEVAKSSVDLYEKPMLSMDTINRITEAVVKRLENKIEKHGVNGVVSSNSTINSRSALGGNINIGNTQIKNSLPQLVQEYINSQLSIQMTKSQSYSVNVKNNQTISFHRQLSNQSTSNPSNWSSRTSLSQALVLQDNVKADIQERLRREIINPFSKKELFFTGSVQKLTNTEERKRSLTSLNVKNPLISESGNPSYLEGGDMNQMITDENNYIDNKNINERNLQDNYGTFRRFIKELLDVNLLKSPTFILMIISSTISMLGIFVPFFVLPVYIISKQMSLSMAGQLISYVGVANIMGRIFATVYIEKAWFSNYPWVDCLWINNIALILAGISAFLVPFLINYYGALIFVLCLYGLCVAGFVSLKSILVVELLGSDKLTNAFGFLLIFQGLAAFFGPPTAAMICDLTNGNYEVSFYFSGVVIIFSGILCCPLRYVSTFERKNIESYNVNAEEENIAMNRVSEMTEGNCKDQNDAPVDVKNTTYFNKDEGGGGGTSNQDNPTTKASDGPDGGVLEPLVEVEEDPNSDHSTKKLESVQK